jgi:hypothetical protein
MNMENEKLMKNSSYFVDQFREFHESVNIHNDLLIYVLRFHLLTENMLERIITGSLPRGANLVQNTRLSYVQKLAVVDALGIIDEKLILALQRLNALRNSCAHKRKLKVIIKEIDPISELFGEKLSTVKPDPDQDPQKTDLNAAVLVTAFFGSHIYQQLNLLLAPLEGCEI